MTAAKKLTSCALGLLAAFALLDPRAAVAAATTATAPATLPRDLNLVRDIEYGRAGDESLRLDASVPDGPGPFPVAIIVHGGGWGSGDKEKDITPLFEPLSRANFTWFTINYRLAPKYRWPACLEDVQTAIRWVKAHAAEYKGDPNRIAILGHSAGGHLVCLAAVVAKEDTRVQAVVGLAPVTDLEADSARRGGVSPALQALFNRPKEIDEEAHKVLREASAITYVKPGLPPFLLIQGDADKTVPIAQTRAFEAKLKEAGVPCELYAVKGAPHSVLAWEKFDPEYKREIIGWLERALGGPATAPAGAKSAAGASPEADAVVAADGTGKFKTIQEAINASPQSNPPRDWVVRVKPGTYKELLYVQREKRFLHLVGDDPEKTVVTYDLYANLPGPDGKGIGTFRTPTAVIDADDFTAENLTFANAAGPKGQALAVRIDGDAVVFRNCRFLGWQDTILGNRGRHYYEGCYIEGAVDFLFGGATEFFEKCHVHCKGNGYITAASTPSFQPYGFVFSHCTITGEPDVKTYLGRPWRPFAAVAYLNTEMSEVVRPEGWNNWGHADREKTVRYAEFQNTGPGASLARRVPWAKELTGAEAGAITVQSVVGGADGWDPTRGERRP